MNTDPNDTDTDDDGVSDYDEVLFGSDPTKPDSDGDLLFDSAEQSRNTNPRSNDTDNDGLEDGPEVILNVNPLSNDTDGDSLKDGFEVTNWLNPVSNDTDGDGLSDGTEFEKGTNPLNPDEDFDGIPDGEDLDSNSTQVPQIILAFDPDPATSELAAKLAEYTNVTVVSKEQLLANYTNSPYIVLVGRPNENAPVGNLTRELLSDAGDVLTKMTESDVNRFAVRYGKWTPTQTVVTLSTPYQSDYVRVLDILRSKTVTMMPNSALAVYNTSLASHYAEGGTLNHTSTLNIALALNEIDTVKTTDATVLATLEEAVNSSSIQITRYDNSTTPQTLTPAKGLGAYEHITGKYLNITASQNIQNTTQEIIDSALIQFYYRESDLDLTGNGVAGDHDDIDENTLTLYFFNETVLQ